MTEKPKPLWRQFYEMTAKQAEAEMAEDLRRAEAGEMSKNEALERAAAWRLAGQHQIAEGEALQRLAAEKW